MVALFSRAWSLTCNFVSALGLHCLGIYKGRLWCQQRMFELCSHVAVLRHTLLPQQSIVGVMAIKDKKKVQSQQGEPLRTQVLTEVATMDGWLDCVSQIHWRPGQYGQNVDVSCLSLLLPGNSSCSDTPCWRCVLHPSPCHGNSDGDHET